MRTGFLFRTHANSRFRVPSVHGHEQQRKVTRAHHHIRDNSHDRKRRGRRRTASNTISGSFEDPSIRRLLTFVCPSETCSSTDSCRSTLETHGNDASSLSDLEGSHAWETSSRCKENAARSIARVLSPFQGGRFADSVDGGRDKSKRNGNQRREPQPKSSADARRVKGRTSTRISGSGKENPLEGQHSGGDGCECDRNDDACAVAGEALSSPAIRAARRFCCSDPSKCRRQERREDASIPLMENDDVRNRGEGHYDAEEAIARQLVCAVRAVMSHGGCTPLETGMHDRQQHARGVRRTMPERIPERTAMHAPKPSQKQFLDDVKSFQQDKHQDKVSSTTSRFAEEGIEQRGMTGAACLRDTMFDSTEDNTLRSTTTAAVYEGVSGVDISQRPRASISPSNSEGLGAACGQTVDWHGLIQDIEPLLERGLIEQTLRRLSDAVIEEPGHGAGQRPSLAPGHDPPEPIISTTSCTNSDDINEVVRNPSHIRAEVTKPTTTLKVKSPVVGSPDCFGNVACMEHRRDAEKRCGLAWCNEVSTLVGAADTEAARTSARLEKSVREEVKNAAVSTIHAMRSPEAVKPMRSRSWGHHILDVTNDRIVGATEEKNEVREVFYKSKWIESGLTALVAD